MHFGSFQCVFVPILSALALSACIAFAADRPLEKAPIGAFAGSKAGQSRSDNGLKMKLIWCPPGRFTMGSPKEERYAAGRTAPVQVTLTEGFWLGQREVTQAEWLRVMQGALWRGRENAREGGNYPATYVNWNGAIEFCEKLTSTEKSA